MGINKKRQIVNTTAFLNKNFKVIMKAYYQRKYKKEIYKMLSFFYDYQKAGNIHMMEAIEIMMLDDDNWSLEKSTKIFGICVYCGFLGGKCQTNYLQINK